MTNNGHKLRVFEAFAGVGSQRMALRNLGIDHEVVGIAEIDKYALKSYEAIHGDCPNYGDISKIDPHTLPDMDLFTYSFPCQDISNAGLRKGLGEGTRSGLLYECEKIIEVKRPKYLLLENVKALVGKKFKVDFDKWLEYLESLGYTNYWQVLNAKNYGVPQNRERVFVVSIYNGEKDAYQFGQGKPLDKAIIDILEHTVDDKFYMDVPFTLVDRENTAALLDIKGFRETREVQTVDMVSPTLNTMQGGNREPKILIPQATKQGYIECEQGGIADFTYPTSKVRRGRVVDDGRSAPTLTTSHVLVTLDGFTDDLSAYRVRKLTPKECWRLMGFSDEDYDKAKATGLSNSQLYKQAGNSIVVPVLEAIFKPLFKEDENE